MVTVANQQWVLAFASDAIATGRKIWLLSVTDKFTRVCLLLKVDTSFASPRVTRALDEVMDGATWKLGRQLTPLTTRAQDMESRIKDEVKVGCALPSTSQGGGQKRRSLVPRRMLGSLWHLSACRSLLHVLIPQEPNPDRLFKHALKAACYNTLISTSGWAGGRVRVFLISAWNRIGTPVATFSNQTGNACQASQRSLLRNGAALPGSGGIPSVRPANSRQSSANSCQIRLRGRLRWTATPR